MTVDEHNLMDDLDADLNKPLVVRSNSSSLKQNQSNSETKKSPVQKHDRHDGKSHSGETSILKKCIRFTKSLIKMMSSSKSPPAQSPLSSPKRSNSSTKKLPVESVDANSKNKSILDGSKPIDQRVKEEKKLTEPSDDVSVLCNNPQSFAALERFYRGRVVVSCPEKGDVDGFYVLIPRTFRELVEIGEKEYGLTNARILSKDGVEFTSIDVVENGDHLVFVGVRNYRVVVSCPEKDDAAGYYVLLPSTIEELVAIGKKKFGLTNARILTTDGIEFDSIDVIQDEDHLVFVEDNTS